MREHEVIQPAHWKQPRGYANGFLCAPDSRMLWIAGQIGWDQQEQLVSDQFHEQFAQALQNVVEVLTIAGGQTTDLARMTFYVLDKREYEAERAQVGEHYRSIVGNHYPACALLEVKGLLESGAKVEIEATAAIKIRRNGE